MLYEAAEAAWGSAGYALLALESEGAESGAAVDDLTVAEAKSSS